IAAALARGVKVIPVLVDGAPMPSARDLPEPLAALARHQALDLRTAQLEQDAERLGTALERLGAGRNAVTWLSLLTRRQLALDPLDLHKPEVLWRALRFLLYMVLLGEILRIPAAAREGQQYWRPGYLVSYAASNYVDWLAAAVLLHFAMRLAGGTAPVQASVAATCFLAAFLPVIGLSQIPVWGLNISVTQGTPALNWTPAQAVDQIQAFTSGLGVFGTIRVMLSFVTATVLWGVLLVAMAKALRTLHRLGWARALTAFAGGWLAYLLFLVFFYAPLVGMVYPAFGLPRPRVACRREERRSASLARPRAPRDRDGAPAVRPGRHRAVLAGLVYPAIFVGASALTTLYLLTVDRTLLERRMRGGPAAEKRPAQKLI